MSILVKTNHDEFKTSVLARYIHKRDSRVRDLVAAFMKKTLSRQRLITDTGRWYGANHFCYCIIDYDDNGIAQVYTRDSLKYWYKTDIDVLLKDIESSEGSLDGMVKIYSRDIAVWMERNRKPKTYAPILDQECSLYHTLGFYNPLLKVRAAVIDLRDDQCSVIVGYN